MPTLELSDEELQGLILVCANASGPGVSWMLTNALLAKAQQAAQAHKASQVPAGPDFRPSVDGLDHEPIGQTRIRASDEPPAFTGKAGARR